MQSMFRVLGIYNFGGRNKKELQLEHKLAAQALQKVKLGFEVLRAHAHT
jgi:hypothetical protein